MGKRSAHETLAAIYTAFLEERTWRQPDLARRVGVGVPALRRQLDELLRCGVPLERSDESPHLVYWSVPPWWFPGAVAFPVAEVPELLRQLGHAPRTRARDALVKRLLGAAGMDPSANPAARVLAPTSSGPEQAYLPLVEESAARRVPLSVRYFSARRGDHRTRSVSVQRVVVGPPARFVAVCHDSDELKWFRVDNVLAGEVAENEPYRARADHLVDTFVARSIDGFHGEQELECAFTVRRPEAAWVRANLPPPLVATDAGDAGIRVAARTAALTQVARFVVSLGAAARAETPELRALVHELATGALGSK